MKLINGLKEKRAVFIYYKTKLILAVSNHSMFDKMKITLVVFLFMDQVIVILVTDIDITIMKMMINGIHSPNLQRKSFMI